jgi:L-rhamnose mutarotase
MMERHAFYARLNAGFEDQYLQAHADMPSTLVNAYRSAGINTLRIFRRGDLLFLYLECEQLNFAMASLESNPIEQQWQALIGPMLQGGDFCKLDEIFELP